MVATINENIRWYKANDPYYYEVDNLPLIDLVQNDKDLRDRLNLLILESNEWVDAAYVQTEVQDAVGNAGIINVNGEGGTLPNNVVDWVLGLGYIKISDIDLTAYVTHTYLNGLNYIDDAALVAYGYATSAWVEIQGFATQAWVNSLNHATQDWVTGKNYATENWVEQKGYIGDAELVQFYASRVIMFSEYNKGPLSLSSPWYLNSTKVALHMGTNSLPNLTHYIVEAQGNNDDNSHSYVKVADGLYSTSRHILRSSGTGAPGADTWNTNQATLAAESPNTNNLVFLVSGWTNIYVKVVGWVETRRFKAALD